MKNKLKLAIGLLLMTGALTGLNAQNINKLEPGKVIRKGTITLTDGIKTKYFNLNNWPDSVSYYHKADSLFKTANLQNVTRITRQGNFALHGFLYSAAITTVVVLILKQAYTITPAGMIKGYLILTAPYTLLGLILPRQITIFSNSPAVSLVPAAGTTFDGKVFPALSLKINLNKIP